MTSLESHPATVDRDRPLARLIDAGRYDHANEYVIEERFPVRGEGVREERLALVCLERGASTEEVGQELDRPELRPAGIAELLALGAAFPDLQRAFPIVALAAAAVYPHDYLRIPFLWGSLRTRRLDLRWDEHRWAANIRFLAVERGRAEQGRD